MSMLENLEPKRVFHYFEEISNIPRPSYKEKKISDYLADFARKQKLEYYQDDLYNIIMIKEATEGYENEEPMILQGHMDMVCEKTPDCTIDFEKDPLKLRVDGDMISAEGTTLGGDDGIAVAYILAILSDETLRHPRIEAVITVSEEVGMDGANGIDLSMLRGHRFLNLDSEKEGVMLSSCAGGSTVLINLPVSRQKPSGSGWSAFEIEISGLLGGHSGDEINKERANANLLMERLFLAMRTDDIAFRIVTMEGGAKQNAIPRQTIAKILVDESKNEAFCAVAKNLQEAVRKEYTISDPDILIQTTPISLPEEMAFDEASTKRAVLLLASLPNGIQSMSCEMPGLVKTSLNLGILRTDKNKIYIEYCVRSSLKSERKYLEQKLLTLVAGLDGSAEVLAEYPAWEYKADSPFREEAVRLFEKMYGKKPKIEAIHAGLECGIFAGKIPNMDGISIGPDMWDIHTTEERLSISSAKRVYEYVVELLQYRHE